MILEAILQQKKVQFDQLSQKLKVLESPAAESNLEVRYSMEFDLNEQIHRSGHRRLCSKKKQNI